MLFLCHIVFKRFPNFEKHLVENLISFLMDCLCSFPSTIFLHPNKPLIFLFLLKVTIGGSWNTSLNSWFIWSKFQLLVVALFTWGNVRLCVNTSGILLLCFFVFSLRSFCLSKVLVFSILLLIFVVFVLFQSICYVIYHSYPRIHRLLRRCANGQSMYKWHASF